MFLRVIWYVGCRDVLGFIVSFCFFGFVFRRDVRTSGQVVTSELGSSSVLTKDLVLGSLSILVCALNDGLAVTIFLCRSTVTYVLLVITLRTLTILILLSARTLTLTVIVSTLRTITINMVCRRITVSVSLLRLTFGSITILLNRLSPAILRIIFPTTGVSITVLPCRDALSKALTVRGLSNMFQATN